MRICGVHQAALALVRHERRDVADHRRPRREPQFLVHISRWLRVDAIHLDALVHGERARVVDAVLDDHGTDRVRRADGGVHLLVLPPGERVALEVEVHPPGDDERGTTPVGQGRQGHGRHRHRVRVVRVDQVGLQVSQHARQPERRGEIHLVGRGEANQIVALAGAPGQLAVRVGDKGGAVAAGAQTEDGQEDLVLAPAPRAGGVDMQSEHILGRP
jgi:hypothetical protein